MQIRKLADAAIVAALLLVSMPELAPETNLIPETQLEAAAPETESEEAL